MTEPNKNKRSESGSYSEVESLINKHLTGIYREFCMKHASGFDLRVKFRGDGDWLAIAKRDGPDGNPEVVFSSGVDLVTCLIALARSIEAGKWRADKPWSG